MQKKLPPVLSYLLVFLLGAVVGVHFLSYAYVVYTQQPVVCDQDFNQ